MQNGIKVFSNYLFGEVRVANENGKGFFAGSDVARALGYARPADAITAHCKGVVVLPTPTKNQHGAIVFQKMKFIPESDLYRLVMRSNLPQAEKFQDWVVEEVLPAIRETGGYIPMKKDESDAEVMARALMVAQRTIEASKRRAEYEAARAEALELQAEKMEKQIEVRDKRFRKDLPRITFAHAIETSDQSILVGELAKIICQNGVQIGQNRLFNYLRDNGYLMKAGDSYNQPTQRSMNAELFEIKKTTITKPNGTTLVTTTSKVTGKGQVYFINKLLKEHATNKIKQNQ